MKSAALIPHFEASEPQLSPLATSVVLHVPSELPPGKVLAAADLFVFHKCVAKIGAVVLLEIGLAYSASTCHSVTAVARLHCGCLAIGPDAKT
jgi:hypothetical protein